MVKCELFYLKFTIYYHNLHIRLLPKNDNVDSRNNLNNNKNVTPTLKKIHFSNSKGKRIIFFARLSQRKQY